MVDLAVALFVALLVFGGLHVPRIADAIGRAVHRPGREPDGGRAGPPRSP